MNNLDQMTKQQYLSLETFRKTGEGVKTPVWFVQDGETIFVRTGADSGKVKRIRRNGRVNITPCKMDGTPVGTWFPATAREISDEPTHQQVERLLDKKYGLMKKLFALGSIFQKRKDTILEIKSGS